MAHVDETVFTSSRLPLVDGPKVSLVYFSDWTVFTGSKGAPRRLTVHQGSRRRSHRFIGIPRGLCIFCICVAHLGTSPVFHAQRGFGHTSTLPGSTPLGPDPGCPRIRAAATTSSGAGAPPRQESAVVRTRQRAQRLPRLQPWAAGRGGPPRSSSRLSFPAGAAPRDQDTAPEAPVVLLIMVRSLRGRMPLSIVWISGSPAPLRPPRRPAARVRAPPSLEPRHRLASSGAGSPLEQGP
ncbi:hypothetical protein NDU88_005316 [Pleurodeles waltl]|uniref:Uncharacterized protein n=1 Tax=Pleurodeles waltl TaxID=8319 RepID=A0AAV7RI60_PLEWA|nr:hypothetical protein NDU88_005316 [Pleurodeles waltl]